MKTNIGANNNATLSASSVSTTGGILIKSEPLSSSASQSELPNTNTTSKRPASLDLKQTTTSGATSSKKQQQQLQLPAPLVIDPSIQDPGSGSKTSLGTPDLEKILHLLPTPQPGRLFPTKASTVTSEQEAFGKGFEEALHSLHNSKSSKASGGSTTVGSTGTSASTSGGSILNGGAFTYTNLESFPITVKDEPVSGRCESPQQVNRIDMEAQEKIKLERKRQRNRVAASKCRKRKLERISKLEEKVKMLKGENTDLALIVKNHKDIIAQLKQQVMEHMQAGCRIQTLCNGQTALMGK